MVRLKTVISGWHAHIHADKTGILYKQILSHWYHFEAQIVDNNIKKYQNSIDWIVDNIGIYKSRFW